jgi:hypothetical protein
MTRSWLQAIGLIMPPLAWALSTQLGQITPYIDCRQNLPWTAVFCATLVVISIVGITAARVLSWRTTRSARFIADTGFLIALVCVFALSLQGAASLLLDPCQR